MHSFLVKGDRPGEDPIFALNQEAGRRAAAGESIVNATIGVLLDDHGVLSVLPTAARVVSQIPTDEWAAYAPVGGSPRFLNAVMDDLFAAHPRMRAAAAAVATPGGTGAVRHALSTFVEPGQAVLTTSFYWGPYAILADEHQRRVVTFDMFEETSGPANTTQFNLASLDAKVGELMASQGRAVIVLNDPCHNPTGYSMSERDWRMAVDIIGRHADRGPVVVLLDAAYAAYSETGLTLPLTALESLLGRALLLVAWSASKTFTQYGLRVGALVALVPDAIERTRVHSALSYAGRGTWSNCNRGGMLAVAKLLGDPDIAREVARDRQVLVDRLSHRVAVFNQAAHTKGLRYPRYDGGFFVTVFTNDAFGAAEKMRADGVFVVPQKGALRVALSAVSEANIPRVIESLAKACG